MESRRIATALLVLRLTIFLVMLIWTIDKFVRPEHAGSVYEHFYFLPGVRRDNHLCNRRGRAFTPAWICYWFRLARDLRFVFLLHAVSTFSSFRQYLHPFEGSNILFFAAWPMLGACFTLY